MYLNKKLNLLYHTKEKTLNANKRIRVILNLKHILPRYSLITYEHLLLDVILITVILSLINPTMKASELEMKRYNRMLRLKYMSYQRNTSNQNEKKTWDWLSKLRRLFLSFKSKIFRLPEYLHCSEHHYCLYVIILVTVET